jgi:murein DD-endopeptidase MepM/ murein hydrolase activator NlpD
MARLRAFGVAVLFALCFLIASPRSASADSIGLNWPASGTVSWNAHDHKNSRENVYAIDIANSGNNVPVTAAASGTVVTASTGKNTLQPR